MIFFRGGGNYSVDEKGRIVIPLKFRFELGKSFLITKGIEECLYIFPEPNWDVITKKLEEKPMFDKYVSDFQRHFFGEAMEANPDGQSRVLLPSELKSYAHIANGSDVKMIGCGRWIEIWDLKRYESYQKNSNAAEMIQVLADWIWQSDGQRASSGNAQ